MAGERCDTKLITLHTQRAQARVEPMLTTILQLPSFLPLEPLPYGGESFVVAE